MVNLDLTQDETNILQTTLENELSDLRYEIGNTDSLDYRNELKEKKVVLKKVLNALDARECQ
ncbi:MAG: hypothetical protein Q9M30_03280 [Mariprofundaceae bacterium]|nr:hypothetical protein [Mariprofundaceae bacterium]